MIDGFDDNNINLLIIYIQLTASLYLLHVVALVSSRETQIGEPAEPHGGDKGNAEVWLGKSKAKECRGRL